MPLISIITPAYNVEPYIAATLDSLLAQTFQDWELVIVDDGSRDGTYAIIQSYAARDPRIRAFTKPNSGAAETRNHALARIAPGSQYVVFMDSDDLYLPDALSSLLSAARAAKGLIGAHGVAEYIDGRGNLVRPGDFATYCRQRIAVQGARIVPVPPDEPTSFAALLVKAFHPPGVFIVRREIVEETGPFDMDTSPQEDWDYWLRIARHGSFAFLDKLILYYRKHDTNASSNFAKSYRKAHYVRHKTFYSPDNTPEQQDLLRRYYKAWQIHKIHEKLPAIPAALRRFRIPQAAKLTVHVAAHWFLYFRGHPTPAN